MVDGKGWHNESTRHRMARLNGSAGGKLKAPRSISKKKKSKDIQLLSNNNEMGLWNKETGWKVKRKSLLAEKKDLVKHYDDLTTSDLQGTVEALAKEHGVDEDDLLNEIKFLQEMVLENNHDTFARKIIERY